MDNKRKEKLLKSVSKEKKSYQKIKMPKIEKETSKDATSEKKEQSSDLLLKRDDKLKNRIEKEKSAYQKSTDDAKTEQIKDKLRLVSQGMDSEASDTEDGLLGKIRQIDKKWIASAVAVVALVGVIIIAVKLGAKGEGSVANQKETNTTTEVATTEAYPIKENNPLVLCENEAVTTLITSYITAMRDVDIETMKTLDLYDGSYDNTANLTNTASVVEDYQDITIYTKNGPYINGLMAYVVTNVKFKNIDKTCQGMFQYVVRKEQDGSYVLDTTPADDIESDEVSNNLITIGNTEDVLTLIDGVNQQCQADIDADENLKAYVQGTLQDTVPGTE